MSSGRIQSFLSKLEHPRFRIERQRDDQHVDPRHAGKRPPALSMFPSFGYPATTGGERRSSRSSKNAADADVVVGVLLDRTDQALGRCSPPPTMTARRSITPFLAQRLIP
jgi:hypothetical protein